MGPFFLGHPVVPACNQVVLPWNLIVPTRRTDLTLIWTWAWQTDRKTDKQLFIQTNRGTLLISFQLNSSSLQPGSSTIELNSSNQMDRPDLGPGPELDRQTEKLTNNYSYRQTGTLVISFQLNSSSLQPGSSTMELNSSNLLLGLKI